MRLHRRLLLIALVACLPTVFAASGLSEASRASARTKRTVRSRPPVRTVTGRAPGPAERMLGLMNRDRAAAGIPPLALHRDLGSIAAEFSGRLAREGGLRHNETFLSAESLERLGARKLGENVGFDASAESVHRRFMESAPHRANILDGDFDAVGIGVMRGPGSLIYFVEDFARGDRFRFRARSGTRPRAR